MVKIGLQLCSLMSQGQMFYCWALKDQPGQPRNDRREERRERSQEGNTEGFLEEGAEWG